MSQLRPSRIIPIVVMMIFTLVSMFTLGRGNYRAYSNFELIAGGLGFLLGIAGVILSLARNRGLAPKILQLSSEIAPDKRRNMNNFMMKISLLLIVASIIFILSSGVIKL